MSTNNPDRPITIFTPSFADEDNTNAQNLTVKEIVARLPEDRFHVSMICQGRPDPRIATRKNTKLLPYYRRGNAARLLLHCLYSSPEVYFFPRCGPLDRTFFDLRKGLRLRTKVVTYIVTTMTEAASAGLMGRSVKEGDRVCANSEFVSGTVREHFGLQPPVVFDGVDRRSFFSRKDQRQPRPLVVLYAGSFRSYKRVDKVIEQAARWPSVQFRLAGKGETEAECRAQSGRSEWNNVTFLGHLSPKDLGEEMRRADVFLFPSILEGHPQVLLQAAACGLPVVAMESYRPEFVRDGVTGFLARSDEELAARLDLLLADASLRENMSARAVKHAADFDLDRIADQWARIFEEVARGKRQSLFHRVAAA